MPGGSRTAGSAQEDAIRNITGQMGETLHTEYYTGSFYNRASTGRRNYPLGDIDSGFPGLDASKVVPTANENRPVNVALPLVLYLGLPT